jgi:hypothetical protein
MSKIELLPCKYCGNEALFHTDYYPKQGEATISVGCNAGEECSGRLRLKTFPTRQEAAVAWNADNAPRSQGDSSRIIIRG